MCPIFSTDGEEISCRREPNVPLAKFASSNDLGRKFVVLAEEEMLADGDLTAGTDEAFPFVWIRLNCRVKRTSTRPRRNRETRDCAGLRA